ncbi:hypothetical protein K402DRAFT_374019 [Aulographum hederae CBS 113979]|uniref:RINT-1 family protein-like protein n=1 Tax=Aulographum hederae CBS 113979 TaxID=1176131 RepID=A0A6G1H5K6_9PEZI|nr:hypothetical protein K402DRAFT_374019 [Aulographum hederae CBS 113979]
MNQKDVRVGDYLDDKLQTTADLDTLDSLLSNVRGQHELLKKQLQDAERDLERAKHAAGDHQGGYMGRARQFDREQDDIDRRLRIITQSDASEDAVRRFESSMNHLQRLDILNGYVELLKEVDALSKECLTQLQVSEDAALDAYRRLQNLELSLGPLQEAAEGGAPHLLDHIAQTTQTVHSKIKSAFAAELEAVLKKIYWPRKEAAIPISLQQDWDSSVGKLLNFQRHELEAKEHSTRTTQPPSVLFPIEILVRPLEQRFRYHFDGDKPTNRLDRPEYFLSHVTELLNTYDGFVHDSLQPLLLAHYRGTDLALNPVYIDATTAFITALLPMVRTKVFSLVSQVSSHPQLLSHLIDELLKFDSIIRDEWNYNGGYGVEGWKGLSWEVLVQKDCFGRWLQIEKDFALTRYLNIIDAEDSGDLDFDSVDPGSTKPTKAAIRVNDLLETVTDRYRPLTSFTQKLRFLLDIQIAIFDRFHERLHSSLEAYLTMTSSLGRTVQGISREEQASLQGVAGLDRLCRVYGSADYLERAMRDWSDDVFFLELWEELQDRARGNVSRSANVAGALSVEQIAAQTSSSVGTTSTEGALFDETAAAYNRLRVRSEGIIVDVLNNNVRESLRAYRNINPWASLASSSSGNTAVTPELTPLLMHLNETLGFLSRALSLPPLNRILRAVCATVTDQFLSQILLRHSFSTAGAVQLSADLDAVAQVLSRYAGQGTSVVKAGLAKVGEAFKLLSLGVKGKGEGEGMLGLWEVEKRLFADNESARGVLEELGMERVGEAEARAILERRVELGS